MALTMVGSSVAAAEPSTAPPLAASTLVQSAQAQMSITDCEAIDVDRPPFNTPSLRPQFELPDPVSGIEAMRVAPIIRETGKNPHTHGVNLYVPSAYPDQPYLNCGFLDVTRAPFNVVPNNPSQATHNRRQINAAMKTARAFMLVTYFPPGTYTVDGTLECAQGLTPQFSGPRFPGDMLHELNFREDRNGACVLMGSTRGPARPIIRLKDRTYTNPQQLHPLLLVWARNNADDGTPPNHPNPCTQVDPNRPECDGKPNRFTETAPGISFNNMIIGIDFTLGNNPGAVGIDLDGAQGSGIEDVIINVGQGHAGLTALPAAGGATHNLVVNGGKYGIDTKAPMNPAHFKDATSLGSVPTVSGSTFRNQSISAIRYSQLESLSLVGVRIRATGSGPAIHSVGASVFGASYAGGVMSIADTSIDFASYQQTTPAIRSNSSVHLSNVYSRNVARVFVGSEAQCTSQCSDSVLRNNDGTGKWLHVTDYAARIKPVRHHQTEVQYDMPIYINGNRQLGDFAPRNQYSVVNRLPADLQSRHQWGDDFPAWDDDNVINVKIEHGAAGDGFTDDTRALQDAINAGSRTGRTVFLPKGYYKVSRPITVQPQTRIVGAARHLSHILAGDFRPAANCGGANAQPVVRTQNAQGGAVRIGLLTINAPFEEECAHPLDWALGGDNIIRSITIKARSRINGSVPNPNAGPVPVAAQVQLRNNASVKWFTYFRDSRYEWNLPSEKFLWIRIVNTEGPISFYQANPEGQGKGAFSKMLIYNSKNVDIYGYKDENINPAIKIIRSNQINVFGYGGIGYVEVGQEESESLFRVVNSCNVRLSGLVNRANPGNSGNPAKWSMVRGWLPVQNRSFSKTEPSDRPILFLVTGGQGCP